MAPAGILLPAGAILIATRKFRLLILVHFLVVLLVVAAGDVLHPLLVVEVPVNGQDDAFLKRGLGIPAQIVLDLGGIDAVAAVVAQTVGHMLDEVLADAVVFQAVMQLADDGLDDEDVALDDTWNYTDILWNGIQAEKVQRAFEKLNYREQTLLEKRLAICMTCGRVGSWKNRPTFEELAVMFEGSTASGAERAYRKAVDKLTEFLVAEGAIHAVRLKQKSKTKRKKKITAAIYEYQADCDGEWGEMSVDFENGTAEIIRLADWDTIKTNWFANEAIRYILSLSPDALKKYMLVPLEPPLIS